MTSTGHVTSTGPVVTSRINTALPVVKQSASVVTNHLSHKSSRSSVVIFSCDATFHHNAFGPHLCANDRTATMLSTRRANKLTRVPSHRPLSTGLLARFIFMTLVCFLASNSDGKPVVFAYNSLVILHLQCCFFPKQNVLLSVICFDITGLAIQ